jgi:hypothetical protein
MYSMWQKNRHYASSCSLLWYRHVNKHCGVKLVLSEEHGGCIRRSRSTWVRPGFWVWTVLLNFLGFCVLLFSSFGLSSSCILCAQCYKKSLDCLFLIFPSVFSIVFLNCSSLCPPSYHYSHCLIAFLTFEPNRLINLLFSIHLPMNILMNTYINVEFDYFLPQNLIPQSCTYRNVQPIPKTHSNPTFMYVYIKMYSL